MMAAVVATVAAAIMMMTTKAMATKTMARNGESVLQRKKMGSCLHEVLGLLVVLVHIQLEPSVALG